MREHRTDTDRARSFDDAIARSGASDEAVAAGYPELPSKRYHYRRWPGGGPEGQVFRVMRAASGPDAMLQVRRHGRGWVLQEAEGIGKVPRAFEAALSDRARLDFTMVEVKASKGSFSADELARLADWQKMATTEITTQVAGELMMINRVMYEFTEPAGALANLTTINQGMLQRRILVKICNESGHERILKDKDELVGIWVWLAQ